MPAAVVAQGPNSVEIPVLFFATAQDAHQYLTEKGFAKGVNTKRYTTWRGDTLWRALEKSYDQEKDIYPEDSPVLALFRDSYYDGCGGVGSLFVRLVDFGKPIVNWDLD